MSKLLTIFVVLLSINTYAIDINNIDIGDKYYYPTNANAFNTFYSLKQPGPIKPSIEYYFKYKASLKTLIDSIQKLTVLRIADTNKQTIKFRYDDGTPGYIHIGFLLTKDDIDRLNAKLFNMTYDKCCCKPKYIKDIMFTGNMVKNTYEIAEEVTLDTCKKGWKTKTTLFGNYVDNVYSKGECVDTYICDQYEKEKIKERERERAW